MLYIITSIADKFFNLLSDDPVRPHIEHSSRVGENKEVFALVNKETVEAMCCVSYQSAIPTSENELFENSFEPNIAIFYTIWSYKAGAGTSLILGILEHLKENKKEIQRYVTLSPNTPVAHRFHIRNGAIVLQKNSETTNYEYVVEKQH